MPKLESQEEVILDYSVSRKKIASDLIRPRKETEEEEDR